jgi:hypothetical protein
LPQISHVEVQLKRGRHHNELTRFRYDVILHVGKEAQPSADPHWIDWREHRFTPAAIRQLLMETKPEMVGIAHVPNARLLTEVRTTNWLTSQEGPETVGDWREAMCGTPETGVDPEQIWALGQELPYSVRITGSASGGDGCYEVLFQRRTTASANGSQVAAPVCRGETVGPRPWSDYVNRPGQGKSADKLVSQLRSFLTGQLPEQMVPSAFVMLEALPLTPNGKVDRRALPAPDRVRPEFTESFVAPRNLVEEVLAGIWADVLGLARVGVDDNFLEIGGHSLLATQLITRVRDIFQVDLPLRRLFEAPTVSQMSNVLIAHETRPGQTEKIARVLKRIEGMSAAEVREALRQPK